jgi:lysophospholipase L1-like esterase
LFQGDSITDAGRPYDVEGKADGETLGHGYVRFLAGRLPVEFPQTRWRIINRGVSGNKVPQLYARWQIDALNLKPDILSILIGVNDVWHGLTEGRLVYNGVPPAHFERTYRTLIDFTLESLPGPRLILGEPFLLRGTAWTEEFQQGIEERQSIVRRIATDYKLDLVPYQSVFDRALTQFTVDDLAPDGVHPTIIGTTIMADAWMQTFKSHP